METNSRVYATFYVIWFLMFSNLIQAESIVSFSLTCSEVIKSHPGSERNILDTNITLNNANSYQANLQSTLSPTRSPSNPVNIELTVKPAIFSGKIYNYVRLDLEIKTYDSYDGKLLYSGVGKTNLSDHLPKNRIRENEEYIFNLPAHDPVLRCVTKLISVIPSSKNAMPDIINFKAQICYDCYSIKYVSEVTDCSLAVGESCEIDIHTFYGNMPTHPRREIKLIDVAIDHVTNDKVLFFNYNDSICMKKLTSEFMGNAADWVDYVFGEFLYIKKQ